MQRGVRPGLAVILAGDNPASQGLCAQQDARLRRNRRALASCSSYRQRGRRSRADANASRALNADPAVHGILVQLPLPKHIDAARVLEAIAPAKDVDGFHEANLGALMAGRPRVVPCTPLGVHAPDRARRACRSRAGTPSSSAARTSSASRWRSCSCKRTRPSPSATRRARDLAGICSAAPTSWSPRSAGRNSSTAAMVKPGACVIDVGINRCPTASSPATSTSTPSSEVAGWITPVPGGVGPMTIAMLLENCIRAASAPK